MPSRALPQEGLRSTITMPDTRRRDPAIQRAQLRKMDLRYDSHLRRGPDKSAVGSTILNHTLLAPGGPVTAREVGLIATAREVAWRSQTNRESQTRPELRQELTRETNAMVQQFNRESKAEVLHLAKADRAGADESKQLLRVYRMLEKAVQEPDRMLWVIEQSMRKRRERPLAQTDDVDDLLASERAVVIESKMELQRVYGQVKRTVREMKVRRAALAAMLKAKKLALGLNSDAYSGAVSGAGFPLPLDWDPPCVSALAEIYSYSQSQREEADAIMGSCASKMAERRAETKRAIAASIQRAKELEREVALAKGQTRIARNETTRNQHKLEITAGRHRGPDSTRYLTVAERANRPLVGNYNASGEHSVGQVTYFETSRRTGNWFDDTLRQTKNDGGDLDVASRQLQAAYADTKHNRDVDTAIRNLRERCSPGRRV